MKTPFKSITASIALLSCLLFLFTDCNIVPVSNLVTLEATYNFRDTFVARVGNAAGTYTVDDKVIAKNFDEFLKKQGIDKQKISTVRVDSVILTIPEKSNLDFNDLEEGVFFVEGLNSLGANVDKLIFTFPTFAGKVVRLSPSFKETYDVRKLLVTSSVVKCGATLKTKRATPRSEIYGHFRFTIGYQVVQ
jgi:hypothetical protein